MNRSSISLSVVLLIAACQVDPPGSDTEAGEDCPTCEPICGDEVCEAGEDCQTCPNDCGGVTCEEEPTAPFFSDDFEGYSAESSLSGTGSGGFSWTGANAGSGEYVQVSDAMSRSGTNALRFHFIGDGGNAWAEQRYNLGRDVTELWVEFYIYFPDGSEPGLNAYLNTNPGGMASNNKLHTHWGVQLSDPTDGEAAYNQNYHTYEIWQQGAEDGVARMYRHIETPEDDPRPGGDISILNSETRGRWVRWRQHARFNSSYDALDAVSETWVDDQKVESVTGVYFETDPAYSLYWRFGYLMGWANSGFTVETDVFIDDVRFFDEDPGWQ